MKHVCSMIRESENEFSIDIPERVKKAITDPISKLYIEVNGEAISNLEDYWVTDYDGDSLWIKTAEDVDADETISVVWEWTPSGGSLCM